MSLSPQIFEERLVARRRSAGARVTYASLLCVLAITSAATAQTRDASPDRGRRVYDRACATCHGTTGRGDGPTAALLGIRPRNFTLGTYRFRTTPSGALPSDADLVRTVTYG